MGVKELWPILACAMDERSLAEFASNEGFRPNQGGNLKLLTIGVDASTWMHSVCPVFQHNHAGAGANPELRILFYRLGAILALPLHALFVFDGPERPLVKRQKQVHRPYHWLAGAFQEMLEIFGFEWYEAPGEAEAELAALTQHGIVDAALTTDNDVLIFGATCVIRPFKQPGHFDRTEIYTDQVIANAAGLSRGDLLLIALLSGGDYDHGIPNCGIKTAYGVSQYKLGRVLLEAFLTKTVINFVDFLRGWRDDLRHMLAIDPEGYIGHNCSMLANSIHDSFPDIKVLRQYLLKPCLGRLASFCASSFRWDCSTVVRKLKSTILEGASVRMLCGLAKQPNDKTLLKPAFKLVYRRAVETIGSRLVVFKVRLVVKEFTDVVSAVLSPSLEQSQQTHENHIFITVPVCVVEYAFPEEAEQFADLDTKKLSSSDASAEARQRARIRAFLHADPVNAGRGTTGSSQDNVIDLTLDSDLEDSQRDTSYKLRG